MENRNWKVLSCEFNMDTACMEVRYIDGNSDGKMISNVMSIYCPAVEDQFAENMYERSELTWLVYNAPADDVNLLFHGDMREYLNTASNQHNERNYEFFWGYQNHVLVDCITGLPVGEMTTTADVADSTVALDILKKTNTYLSVEECIFIGDKAYDVKAIYNTVQELYHGDGVVPLNKRKTKNPAKLPCGAPICEAGLAMHRDGKFTEKGKTRQKYCCPYKRTAHLHDSPCTVYDVWKVRQWHNKAVD